MQITTTYEITPNHINPQHGALTIRVLVNGTEVGSVQPLSGGPIADIRAFAAGEITMAEVRRRWGFAPALAERAFENPVAVEIAKAYVDVTQPYLNLPVGTKATLMFNPASRGYQLQVNGFGIIQLSEYLGLNLETYFRAC